MAGLDELHPWLVQWHGEVDPRYGANSPADTIGQFVASQCAGLGVARESLSAWRPPAATRGRRTSRN